MIVKFFKSKDSTNRGQSPDVIRYIFGSTKEKSVNSANHIHTGVAEKIHFVGSSKNLTIVDPMYALANGEVKKLNGADADLSEIIEAFEASEALNTTAKFPVEHFMMSIHEDEELTMEEWQEAVEYFMRNMGWGNCTWVATLHQDTDKDHVHVALMNISNEPLHNSINPSNKFQRAAEIRRELEVRYRLKQDPSPFLDMDADFNPKLSKNLVRNTVRQAIREILSSTEQLTLPQFMIEMQKRDVGVFASLKNQETQVLGLSFSYRGQRIKASALGDDFKSKNIMQTVDYNKERDVEEVTLLNKHEKQRMEVFDSLRDEAEKVSEYAIEGLSQEFYLVTVLDRDEIASTFEREPHVKIQDNTSPSSIMCAIKAKLDNEVKDSSPEIEHAYAGETASQFYKRVDKKKAGEHAKHMKELEAKRLKKLRETLRALMAAFCSSSPRNYEKHWKPLQRNYVMPNVLSSKYAEIENNKPVAVVSREQLLELILRVNADSTSTLKVIRNTIGTKNSEYCVYLDDSGSARVINRAKGSLSRNVTRDNDMFFS